MIAFERIASHKNTGDDNTRAAFVLRHPTNQKLSLGDGFYIMIYYCGCHGLGENYL